MVPRAGVDPIALAALVRANLDHLRPWMPWAHPGYGLPDVRAWVESTDESFVICEHGAPIGSAGYNRADPINHSVAVGYWLAAEHQGRGIVTAAVRGLCAHAFETLALHRVELRAAPDNVRSRAVAERCGFVEEGIARGAERFGDTYRDLVVHSLLAPR